MGSYWTFGGHFDKWNSKWFFFFLWVRSLWAYLDLLVSFGLHGEGYFGGLFFICFYDPAV